MNIVNYIGLVETSVMLRENLRTLFVVRWWGMGCGMNSPLRVCVMRSIRIPVGVTFTMRPYSVSPLLANAHVRPMQSVACSGQDMRGPMFVAKLVIGRICSNV